jgi:phosphoglycerate dehydrogenase-like enzyme
MKIVVQGVGDPQEVPGIETLGAEYEVAFAPDTQTLKAAIPGADILLGWRFNRSGLQESWPLAKALRWIQWSGAGVDSLLFPALVDSDVIVTNARGIYDRAMAEYVIGLMLAQAKGFAETFASQARREWNFRFTERLAGTRVAFVGVGSIAREVGGLLKAFGLAIEGVGRTARRGVPVFGDVHGFPSLAQVVGRADWVVAVLPRTPDTENVFDAGFFAAMKPGARFINIGRGTCVDEAALVAALESGHLKGAALDVFRTEPLDKADPLWSAPNLIVSPHMSGDYVEYRTSLFALFADNLARFRNGEPLRNVVDKAAGYVRD